jgi:hypothetical protein
MTAAVRVLAIMEEVERLARVAPPVEMEPLLARGAELERRLDQAVAEWAATVH